MTSASTRETTHILNGLITVCNDDIRVQERAARAVNGVRRHRLEDASRRRGTFVHELSQLIRESGGDPTVGGSMFERSRAVLVNARMLLIGEHAADRYADCARVEGKAHDRYELALKHDLGEQLRVVIEGQRAQIFIDRDEWLKCRLI